MLEHIFQVVGKSIEIVGIILTTGNILSITRGQLPLVLMTAVWRGKMAKKALAAADLFGEDSQIALLQGLILVMLGILIQASYHLGVIVHDVFDLLWYFFPCDSGPSPRK